MESATGMDNRLERRMRMWRRKLDLSWKNFNIAKIDIEASTSYTHFDSTATADELVSYYSISGIPHMILLDAQGNQLGRIRGYYTHDSFSATLQNIINTCWSVSGWNTN